MAFRLSFTRTAEKELEKLPKKTAHAVLEQCAVLEQGKQITDTKKLHPPLNGWRLRVGRYRILYVLDKTTITVYAIRHRKDAYR
jgi:mRNA-degrading endonuclease RelE of RelBE toxin-antitoxin system